jgi:hypothetical protein
MRTITIAAAILAGLGTAVTASAECTLERFSALPHSFEGLETCGEQDEWVQASEQRCLERAEELFGEFDEISVGIPSYSGTYSTWNDCIRYDRGRCIERVRRCRAFFERLDCTVLLCT